MAWLSGYQYRQKIPIGNCSDGSQTDYQKKITLVKGTGSSSAGTIYLQNHSLNWPNDIRFTKSDGTQIDFWRQEYDATDGTWWVELPNIDSTNSTDYYIYYGKSSDSDASNISNAFIFGDDFQYSWTDDDLNAGEHTDWDNKWIHRNTDGTSAIEDDGSNRVLSLYNPNSGSWLIEGWTTYNTISYPYIVDYEFAPKQAHTGSNWAALETNYYTDSSNYTKAMYTKYSGGEIVCLFKTDGSSTTTNITLTQDTWYRFEAIFSNNDFHLYIDDTLKVDYTTGSPASSYKPSIQVVSKNGGAHYHVDNFRIRKYTANDPSWSSPSSEEAMSSNFFLFFNN